jgi:hypothetical protein
MPPAVSSAISAELKAFSLDCRPDYNLAYQY